MQILGPADCHTLSFVTIDQNNQIRIIISESKVFKFDTGTELNAVIAAIVASDCVKTVTKVPDISILPASALNNIPAFSAGNGVIAHSSGDLVFAAFGINRVTVVRQLQNFIFIILVISQRNVCQMNNSAVTKAQVLNFITLS